jgi:hypothetical protein
VGRYALVAEILYEVVADPEPDLAVPNGVRVEVDGEHGGRSVALDTLINK